LCSRPQDRHYLIREIGRTFFQRKEEDRFPWLVEVGTITSNSKKLLLGGEGKGEPGLFDEKEGGRLRKLKQRDERHFITSGKEKQKKQTAFAREEGEPAIRTERRQRRSKESRDLLLPGGDHESLSPTTKKEISYTDN